MEAIVQRYSCHAIGRSVRLRVLVERVSGIGDDENEVVELARTCVFAKCCPWLPQCPLTTDEESAPT